MSRGCFGDSIGLRELLRRAIDIALTCVNRARLRSEQRDFAARVARASARAFFCGLQAEREADHSGDRRSASGCAGATSRRLSERCLLHLAGAETKDRVRRAPAERARGERDDAEPAPPAHRVGSGERDQYEAQNDAENAVNAANVAFHDACPFA